MKHRTTLSDIARELDVTPATVSRALGDHPKISQATKQAVLEAAKRLNYQPNSIASALRRGKSNIIGVIVPTSDRQFFATIIRGIEEVTREQGYHLLICQTDEQTITEKKVIDTFLQIRVDGIIACVAKETTDYAPYKAIVAQAVPLVLYDRIIPLETVCSVTSNDFKGAYHAVDHLIQQGCRRIAHFAGQQHLQMYTDRRNGYIQALKKHHLPVDESLIIETDLIDKTDTILKLGSALMGELMNRGNRPDAMFSASDFAAIGALQKLKQSGFSIPHDIALAGYSNDLTAQIVDPGLTSVDQLTKIMGNTAGRLLLNQTQGEHRTEKTHRIVIDPELVVRASSAKTVSVT